MQNKALVVIDIQKDITKNYKEIIGNINGAIDLAVNNDIHVVYIRHENLSAGGKEFQARDFRSGVGPGPEHRLGQCFYQT